MVDLEDTLSFAVELAHEAGASTLEHFQAGDLRVRTKDDGTPVTEADARAERILRERIAAAFPDDGILGEEEDDTEGSSGRVWIVDPIDGTFSFARGVPLYGTLIGMEQAGETVLGVVHMPALGETVYAAAGQGARWRTRDGSERAARVSTVSKLSEALLSTTSWDGIDEFGQTEAYSRLRRVVRKERGYCDCFGLMLVATGRADVMFEPALEVWDCAPFLPILEEAGGTFTDLAGVRTIRGGNGLATNGRLHDEALAVIRG